jgi:hypothetical protein
VRNSGLSHRCAQTTRQNDPSRRFYKDAKHFFLGSKKRDKPGYADEIEALRKSHAVLGTCRGLWLRLRIFRLIQTNQDRTRGWRSG